MKSILITGSNKGIGYGIIEGLLKRKSPFNIILTSRDIGRGKKAIENLSSKYPSEKNKLHYLQLDITNKESISNLISSIKTNYKKIDYLIDNAGVCVNKSKPDVESFNYIFNTNVDSTINFTMELISNELINKNGKIIILGSELGNINNISNKTLKNEIKNSKTIEDLLKIRDKYKKSLLNNTLEEDGWTLTYNWGVYSASKVLINNFARILSYNKYIIDNKIGAYVVWPGWVKTDMGGPCATYTIEEGIVTPLFVIDLPDEINIKYQGKNFFHCKVVEQ